MKKLFIIIVFVSSTIITGAQTTCDLIIGGTNADHATYYVTWKVYDYYNGYPTTIYTGPTSPLQVYYGTNDNVTVSLDVTPDASKRWIIEAEVNRYISGQPTVKKVSDTYLYNSLLMSSDEYYYGIGTVSVSF